MGKRRRIDLSEFLTRPRLLQEIVEHYRVTTKIAALHLRKAAESGQVLISEAPIFRTFKDSSGNLKKLGGFVYVHSKNLPRSRRELKFTLLGNEGLPKFRNKAGPENHPTATDTSHSLVSKLNVTSARSVSEKRGRLDRECAPRYQKSVNNKPRSLQWAEKTSLFEAMQKPSSFLDLHARFNVSKETMNGLVKKGFLKETWGSDGVGLTFNLSGKGKKYLEELEAESKYEPTLRKSPLTRLRQRSF
jgi:hypothetical protein